jgi:hypothetical protein
VPGSGHQRGGHHRPSRSRSFVTVKDKLALLHGVGDLPPKVNILAALMRWSCAAVLGEVAPKASVL